MPEPCLWVSQSVLQQTLDDSRVVLVYSHISTDPPGLVTCFLVLEPWMNCFFLAVPVSALANEQLKSTNLREVAPVKVTYKIYTQKMPLSTIVWARCPHPDNCAVRFYVLLTGALDGHYDNLQVYRE